MDNRPIGILDSGVGGLSAAKHILSEHPEESIVCFGDTARVPYGNKSKEEITDLSLQCMRFLHTFDLKAILICCNTITVCSLDKIGKKFPEVPVIGVVDSAVNAAAKNATRTHHIGVIGTRATINSGAYTWLLKEIDEKAKVFAVACPKLVPLIEEGCAITKEERLQKAIERYLGPLKEEGIDTLILGCTHYSLIADMVGDELGEDVTLIDSGAESVKGLMDLLRDRDGLADPEGQGEEAYYCSGDVNTFAHVAGYFLGKDVLPHTKHVEIERY